MAEKVLNLTLIYKNKILDKARYNRDFTKTFQIGSDRHLFWQILDKAFPVRHKLLTKIGSKYKIHLTSNMGVQLESDGETLSRADLETSKQISGSSLLIDNNSRGIVNLAKNWEIEFNFSEPYQSIANPEEIRIAKQFAKRPAKSLEDRRTSIMLLTGLILTAILLYFANIYYVPPMQINLQERFEKIQEIATRVTPDYEEEEQPEVQVEVDVAKKKAKTEEHAQEVVEQAEQTSVQEFEDMFGSGFGDEDFEADIFEVDIIGEIAVVGDGSDMTSTGSVTADRPITAGSQTLEQASSSTIDLSEGFSSMDGLDAIDLGGGMGLEEIDLSSLGGSTENFKVTQVQTKQQLAAVKRRFAEIKTVEETDLEMETVTPQEKNQLSNINMIVNTYKPQITRLYISERMKMEMYGTLGFVLYIESSGKVVGVDIKPTSGSFFTDAFLEKARQIVLNWKINVVTEDLTYSFRMKFVSQ